MIEQDQQQMAKPRVVVVGARRVRTGTGPFLALQIADAGADVNAVIGTNLANATVASDWLKVRGVKATPFVDWDEMMAEAAPDALVLASPAGTHLPWLKVALASGVHVLCEKPLLASARTDASAVVHTAEEDHAEAKELARAFASAGLLLRENCQWPYTLSDFSKLHPSADLTKASWFEMLMSPSGEGVNRWLELLSHPVSLLQEVAPGPVEIIDPHYHQDRELRFTWRTVNRELECLVGIVPDTVYPRPAEFSFDGCLMKRSINQENYQFSFSSGAEEILADDPMPQSVAAFLRELHKAKQHSCAPMNEDLVRRQKVLAELLNARS